MYIVVASVYMYILVYIAIYTCKCGRVGTLGNWQLALGIILEHYLHNIYVRVTRHLGELLNISCALYGMVWCHHDTCV